MQMPKVRECGVSDCAYNTHKQCHALAITVGDGMVPHCDTYCNMSPKGGDKSATASVGACKVPSCSHNKSLECQASEICVGYMHNDVECMTFDKK